MKRGLPLLLGLIAVLLIGTSCSIQKRQHRKGFYIAGLGSRQAQPAAKPAENSAKFSLRQVPGEVIAVSHQLEASVLQSSVPFTTNRRPVALWPLADSCDLVIMRSGEEMRVKMLEISTDLIRFKKCDNLGGPVYSVKKDEIFMIKYVNGTREVMKAPAEPQVTTARPATQVAATPKASKRLLGMSLIAFIASIVGLLMPTIVLGVVVEAASFILGVSALSRINKYPDYYSGRGFAVTAIVISVIILTVLVMVLMVI